MTPAQHARQGGETVPPLAPRAPGHRRRRRWPRTERQHSARPLRQGAKSASRAASVRVAVTLRAVAFAVDLDHYSDDGASAIAALIAEYERYVRDQHASCWRCPVVLSGVQIVASMLEWKAARGDGRLEHWTRQGIRDYLLRYLPTTTVSRALLVHAPTCAKDLAYFLSARGTLEGDDVGVLADATDEVLYMQTKPLVLISSGPNRAERRNPRRTTARSARTRNRRN